MKTTSLSWSSKDPKSIRLCQPTSSTCLADSAVVLAASDCTLVKKNKHQINMWLDDSKAYHVHSSMKYLREFYFADWQIFRILRRETNLSYSRWLHDIFCWRLLFVISDSSGAPLKTEVSYYCLSSWGYATTILKRLFIRPVHTRDQSALEVHLKSSGLEVFFGKTTQWIFRHDCT